MKKTLFVLLSFGLSASCLSASSFILSASWPSNSKASLVRRCDKLLLHRPNPVEELYLPPHYTQTGSRSDESAIKIDALAAYRLGVCHKLTGADSYANAAIKIIRSWLIFKKAASSQARNEINFYGPYLIYPAYWLRGRDRDFDAKFEKFLKKIILPLSAWKRENNHANWGVLLNALIATYTKDKSLLKQSLERWKEMIIQQVDENGILNKEICRSDTNNYCGGPTKGKKGIAYTHFTLLPTALAAQVFEGN